MEFAIVVRYVRSSNRREWFCRTKLCVSVVVYGTLFWKVFLFCTGRKEGGFRRRSKGGTAEQEEEEERR